MSEARVAVAGAGPAGLTAAWALARAGARVTVFEAQPAAGGRTRTDVVDGCRIDTATQLFGTVYTRFLAVLREAGGAALCQRAEGRDALWRGGRAHEVVYGSPTRMLASGALPFGLKLKLGTHYLPYLHRHAHDLDLMALERAAAAGLDSESAAAWGQRELGHDFVSLLADPLLSTLYGCTAAEASAGFYHALARQGMSLQVVALRGGAGSFCELLAREIAGRGGEVRTSSMVTAVRTAADGAEVSTAAGSERFDALVLAVPAPAAASLAAAWMPEGAEWLRRIQVRPSVTLGIVLDRPAAVRWFGLSFARGESRAVAAVCAEEAKHAGLAPTDRGVLVVFPRPEVGPGLLDASAADAWAAVAPDLRQVFPWIEGAVRTVRVYRWEHAWTVMRPGSLGHLARARAGVLDAEPRIALAGDYLYAPTVEGAVTAGLRAADRIASALHLSSGG